MKLIAEVKCGRCGGPAAIVKITPDIEPGSVTITRADLAKAKAEIAKLRAALSEIKREVGSSTRAWLLASQSLASEKSE